MSKIIQSSEHVMQMVDAGKTEQALAEARRLTEEAPADPAVWRALAYAQAARKTYREAEQSLKHAISLAPQDAMTWEYLGWLYRQCGEFARAIPALQKSLLIDPSKVRPRMMLANSLADLGKVKRAIAEYEHVLQREPDHVRAHNNLANLLANKGQLESAARHYVRAAAGSDELTYQISGAHASRRIGDWATAEKLEQRLVHLLRTRKR